MAHKAFDRGYPEHIKIRVNFILHTKFIHRTVFLCIIEQIQRPETGRWDALSVLELVEIDV